MPAKSKKQQKAAGAALAAKRGKAPKSGLKGASKGMAKSMSEKQLRELAGTKRKKLPTKAGTATKSTKTKGKAAGSKTKGKASGNKAKSSSRNTAAGKSKSRKTTKN